MKPSECTVKLRINLGWIQGSKLAECTHKRQRINSGWIHSSESPVSSNPLKSRNNHLGGLLLSIRGSIPPKRTKFTEESSNPQVVILMLPAGILPPRRHTAPPMAILGRPNLPVPPLMASTFLNASNPPPGYPHMPPQDRVRSSWEPVMYAQHLASPTQSAAVAAPSTSRGVPEAMPTSYRSRICMILARFP